MGTCNECQEVLCKIFFQYRMQIILEKKTIIDVQGRFNIVSQFIRGGFV